MFEPIVYTDKSGGRDSKGNRLVYQPLAGYLLLRLEPGANVASFARRVTEFGGNLLLERFDIPSSALVILETEDAAQAFLAAEGLSRERGIRGPWPLFRDLDGNTRAFHQDQVTLILKDGRQRNDLPQPGLVEEIIDYPVPEVLTATLRRDDNKIDRSEDLRTAVDYFNSIDSVRYAGPSESSLDDRLLVGDQSHSFRIFPHLGCAAEGEIDMAIKLVRSQEAWSLLADNVTNEELRRSVTCLTDNRVDRDHPDLVNAIIDDYDPELWDFVPKEIGYRRRRHGTSTAGTISATLGNPQQGVAGIAPMLKLIPAEIKLTMNKYEWRISAIKAATKWATANPDRRLVLQCGWRVSGGDDSKIKDALLDARNANVVVVVAAGNDEEEGGRDVCAKPVTYPAAYSELLTVAAVELEDPESHPLKFKKDPESNFGTAVDLSAPGLKCTTHPNRRFAKFENTSAASAIVSGAAALVRAANSDLDVDTVSEILIHTGKSIQDPDYPDQLGELVNCAAAVEEALSRK